MIIIVTEEELESVAELSHRLQNSTSVENVWISHLFMMETSFLSQSLPAGWATWCGSVKKTRPQSYLSTHQTHARTRTYNFGDFSSRHGVPCLLYRSDDATASCWSQMFHSEEPARVTWIWMRTWEAHNGTENVKQKKTEGSISPSYHCAENSDDCSNLWHCSQPVCAASSGLALIHSQVCSFRPQSSVLPCLFQFAPFCLAMINKTCLGSGECAPVCSRGGVRRPPLCLGKMAFPKEHVGNIKSCDLAAPVLWSCSSACSSLQ